MIELCSVHDLNEGESLGFDITDKPVFAVRKDGEIFVYHNECPHLGVELEFQENDFLDLDGALIQCSTHGALFEIETGHCLSGPCQGDYLKPAEFTVKDDLLYLVS
ncbi:MAG: Rieske (2Fe-2S) protein [Saccharospirillum sp.]|uniref:Rieske (2Fe-2S) protein n=1 Tax=Saccharospirillum sp. TaxID=2033801 RepID=UPI00329701B3